MTLLEAMSTALPIIATGVGDNAKVIQNGINGIIVPPGDPVSLSTANTRFLEGCDLSIMLQYQELSTSSKSVAATRPKSNASDNQISIRRHGDIGGYSEAQRFNVRLRAGDTKLDE